MSLKKCFITVLLLLSVLSLFCVMNSKQVFAGTSVVNNVYNVYTVYANRTNIPTDRIWIITFEEDMQMTNLSKYIYVTTDENGKNKVRGTKVKINPDNPSKSMLLSPPSKGWIAGKVYYLFVDKNIKLITGETTMPRTVRMKFTIIDEKDIAINVNKTYSRNIEDEDSMIK